MRVPTAGQMSFVIWVFIIVMFASGLLAKEVAKTKQGQLVSMSYSIALFLSL